MPVVGRPVWLKVVSTSFGPFRLSLPVTPYCRPVLMSWLPPRNASMTCDSLTAVPHFQLRFSFHAVMPPVILPVSWSSMRVSTLGTPSSSGFTELCRKKPE